MRSGYGQRSSFRVGSWVATVGFALASCLGAEEPPIQVNPNRPTFATPASTTQIGGVELEFGLEQVLLRGGSGLFFSPFLLKLGVLKRLELRLGGNGLLHLTPPRVSSATGFGDITLGAQWFYLRGGPLGVDQAVQIDWKLPTASVRHGLGSGEADRALILILSRDVGAFHVDANLQETWLGRPTAAGPGTARQTAGTISVSRTLDEEWSLTAEIYSIGATPDNARIVSNLWAVGYKMSPSLILDAGVDVGLSHGAQKVSFFAGVTTGLGRFRHLSVP